MIKLTKTFILSSAIVLLASCGTQPNIEEEESSGLIRITEQQFLEEQMSMGKPEIRLFKDLVRSTGYVVSLPNGRYSSRAILSGTIHKILCKNGQYVKAGEVLMEISGNELIDLQKEFAEIAVLRKRLKIDFDRVRALYDEKVGSEKELIFAESEYKAANASYQGLKLKIESLNLNPKKIEDGSFYSTYPLKSKINGKVSDLKAVLGSYVEPQTELIDILAPDEVQLRLSVFSKDIHRLKANQKVSFKLNGSDKLFSATLTSVGSSVNEDTKAVSCYANLSEKSIPGLVSNAFVEAEISVDEQKVPSLPSQAILKADGKHYVLFFEKKEGSDYLFRKVAVKTGRLENEYIELLDVKIEKQLLISGVYTVVIE